MTALAAFEAFARDPLEPARRWKSGGGKVVGYLCDNVPVELIQAAGMLPVRLHGGGTSSTGHVRNIIDGLFPPDVTSRPAFVDAMLERLLDGSYACLDYLVIPHNRHAIQSIYRELKTAGAENRAMHMPELFFLDKAWCTSSQAAASFDRDSVIGLRQTLERWSGRSIHDSKISECVRAAKEHRDLLRRALALRCADLPKLSGVQALSIVASSVQMPRSEHMQLLQSLLSERDALPVHSGMRVFIGGSPVDHPELYRIVESFVATVVAEDHCWGSRSAEADVGASSAAGTDALSELSDRFHTRSACSVALPMKRGVEDCVRRAREARSQAAIFYVMKEDWTHNWETPARIRALKAQGVACLSLSAKPYALLAQDESIRDAIGAFLTQVQR